MRARAARGWQERLVAALMLMLKPVRARTGNRNERSATGSARMQKVDATATGTLRNGHWPSLTQYWNRQGFRRNRSAWRP